MVIFLPQSQAFKFVFTTVSKTFLFLTHQKYSFMYQSTPNQGFSFYSVRQSLLLMLWRIFLSNYSPMKLDIFAGETSCSCAKTNLSLVFHSAQRFTSSPVLSPSVLSSSCWSQQWGSPWDWTWKDSTWLSCSCSSLF